MWRCIQNDLDSKVAPAKSHLLASSNSLAKRLRKQLKERAGSNLDPSAPNLGCEMAAGRPQSKWRRDRLLKTRMDRIKKRMRRLGAIRRAGGDTRRIYNTGIYAATTFGNEVTGLSNSQLAIAQQQY